MILPSNVRVKVSKKFSPTMFGGLLFDLFKPLQVGTIESQVVKTSTSALMITANVRGLFKYKIGTIGRRSEDCNQVSPL